MQPPMSWTFIHGRVILPNISSTVQWINIKPGIIAKSDIMNDLILFIGHCDLYFMVQHF